jgi:hypothetical protein
MTAHPPAPLLTIVVPSYNAQDYLHRAIEPLLEVRGIEVIVVNDGSTDATGTIADSYAALRPDVVRVVHQANGGHGGAIETGIEHARGLYLKVLDADDWLSIPSLDYALNTLGRLEPAGGVDALVTDFIHDRVGKANRVSRFDTVFPADRVFGWDDTQKFGTRQFLLMHALIYRTEVVRRSGLSLPRHTYYVDNLYVLIPLAHVRRMYYLPVGLYHYFIGRVDQSVNADVMVRNIDQQLLVNRIALSSLPSPADVASGAVPPRLYAALVHYVEALCAVTSATLARGGRSTHLAKRDAFWRELAITNPVVYRKMRRSFIGASSNLKGTTGRRVTSLAYHVARRVIGFS